MSSCGIDSSCGCFDDCCKNSRKEKKNMIVWSAIANLVEIIADLGAGAASWGMNYEPEVPEMLKK